MFQASPVGFLALAAVAMCWTLAIALYHVGAPDSVARKLALLLVVEGVTLVTSGYIDLVLTPAIHGHRLYQVWFRGEFAVHTFGDCAMLALYPPFLAAALKTRLTQPLADSRVRLAVAGASILLYIAVMATPMRFGASILYIALATLFWFALVASIHAWLLASGDARTRARSFALAFGIRDICWGVVYGNVVWQIWAGTMAEVPADSSDPTYLIYVLGTLLAVPLIAYGILRTHLFDIDLRIRWTIKQSTLAAVVVSIVYVLSEGASRFLSSELGNIAGLLATAVVLFFLAPLQRFAERVARTAMPTTQNTPEYAAFRKLQVYEAAVAEALQGDGISQRERALLNRLRDTLGISAVDAETVERDLSASGQAVGSS